MAASAQKPFRFITISRATTRLGAALMCAALLCGAAPTQSPSQIYGQLFEDVQTARIFPDSKTFADAVPRQSPALVLEAYRREAPHDPNALKAFVLHYFDVPGIAAVQAATSAPTAPVTLRGHIAALWPHLTLPALSPPPGSSALALPAPYVVPGGRFRELFYWDSYFTMLGLKADRQDVLVGSMLADFTSLIERYGLIPNATRSYYLGRSQPPFFWLMVDLAGPTDAATATRYLSGLKGEHAFWMAGGEALTPGSAARRVVRMPDGSVLNRYWDDQTGPRDEAWPEDIATARTSGRPVETVYRDIRAGAESGWDYSSRWQTDPMRLDTIHTTDIVPVDLNSLLWGMEQTIARRCAQAGDAPCSVQYTRLARDRGRAIARYLWVEHDGRFGDWDYRQARVTSSVSAATLYPLFVGLADAHQAHLVATMTRARLLASGGLRTTVLASHQQWDMPNGWAPLQWIAIDGLARYGERPLARTIAARWIGTVDAAYRETGKLLEKYDVEERRPGGGGEYPLQDGFGWTNGVTRAILQRYPDLDPG